MSNILLLIGIIGIVLSQLPLWSVEITFGCQLFPIQHNLRKEVKNNGKYKRHQKQNKTAHILEECLSS